MPDLRLWHMVITRSVEVAGVAVILVGAAIATTRFVISWWTRSFDDASRGYRRDLGRAILLGLEWLVAADIINTVAVDPTFRSVGVLAGIVLIPHVSELFARRRDQRAGALAARRSGGAAAHVISQPHHVRPPGVRIPRQVLGPQVRCCCSGPVVDHAINDLASLLQRDDVVTAVRI